MRNYRIELEIYEGKGGQLRKSGDQIVYPDLVRGGICAWMCRGGGESGYEVGDTFRYPEDTGSLCPWLMDSLRGVV